MRVRLLRDRTYADGAVLKAGTELSTVDPRHESWVRYQRTHDHHVCVVYQGHNRYLEVGVDVEDITPRR